MATAAFISPTPISPNEFNLSSGLLDVEVELNAGSWVLVVFMGIVSVVTVLGNLIVLLSYYIDKNIRHPSNYFIFSLAISDLIIGLEGIPVYTYFFVKEQHWPFGAFLCDLWLSIDYSCCLASIYTVLGITIDSVLFSVSIFGYGVFSGQGRILKEDECYVQFMTNPYLNMSMYIAYYWSTLFVMLYLYYGIYKAAKALAVKSDQKQKRLAILSEMRKSKKETHSTIAVSEAALSNSAPESQPDTSDSLYSRNNPTKLTNAGNGKVQKPTETTELLRQSKSTDKLNKQEERDLITEKSEKSLERMLEMSTVQEPSITVSMVPVENDDISLAFSIIEEIPFIDEENAATKSFIKRAKTPIPLKEFKERQKTPSPSPSPPPPPTSSAEPSPSTPPQPVLIRTSPDPIHHHNDKNNNNCIMGHSHVTRLKQMAMDRPSTFTSMDTPPMSTTNTYPSLSVVVEKSSNGPLTMRRLLTVMRHTSAHRSRKRRKTHQAKGMQSKSENRAKKALRVITFILGSFTILWTPFYVLATIYGFCERCKLSEDFNLLYAISYYLCYMNSPLNPICYAFANQQFKRAFKRILRGDFRRT